MDKLRTHTYIRHETQTQTHNHTDTHAHTLTTQQTKHVSFCVFFFLVSFMVDWLPSMILFIRFLARSTLLIFLSVFMRLCLFVSLFSLLAVSGALLVLLAFCVLWAVAYSHLFSLCLQVLVQALLVLLDFCGLSFCAFLRRCLAASLGIQLLVRLLQ